MKIWGERFLNPGCHVIWSVDREPSYNSSQSYVSTKYYSMTALSAEPDL